MESTTSEPLVELFAELYRRCAYCMRNISQQLVYGPPYYDPETREEIKIRKVLELLVNEYIWMDEIGKIVYDKLTRRGVVLGTETPEQLMQRVFPLLEANIGKMGILTYVLFEARRKSCCKTISKKS